MPCWLEEIYVMPVVWAGVLILLSICAYAIGRPGWGVICGLAALFVRELAAPYAIVCLIAGPAPAALARSVAWLIGLAAYGAFYLWHARQAMALVGPNDLAHAGGWLQFGGAAFVISIAQMNAFLLLLPQWVTALLLPLAILGFAGWNTPTGLRAGSTVCVFLTMFAFFGIDDQSVLGLADRAAVVPGSGAIAPRTGCIYSAAPEGDCSVLAPSSANI